MQSQVSRRGNSYIIFLLHSALHRLALRFFLMALFRYSLKYLLLYMVCVFTCQRLMLIDANSEGKMTPCNGIITAVLLEDTNNSILQTKKELPYLKFVTQKTLLCL